MTIEKHIKNTSLYEEKIDSLENRVNQLEYFIENQPKQINITVKTNK